MLCAFFGAGIGNWLRATLTKRLYTASLCCQQRGAGLYGLRCPFKRSGTGLPRFQRASGRIYLRHAVYYSRISVHYKRYRPGKTRYAFRSGTSRLFADHRYRCCAGSLGDGAPALTWKPIRILYLSVCPIPQCCCSAWRQASAAYSGFPSCSTAPINWRPWPASSAPSLTPSAWSL